MAHEVSWPPISPKAALLSSPSGRKKYEAIQNSLSPLKRSAPTPNLLDKLRAARRNTELVPDAHGSDELEEDEETLQLQLAAIEAKLKLKKLQQSKSAGATPTRGGSSPSSTHGSTSTAPRLLARRQEPPLPPLERPSHVEVKVSPSKRLESTQQNKSPSRVRLGIDKGLRGADISLRRANTTACSTRERKNSTFSGSVRPSSRSSALDSSRSIVSSTATVSIEGRKTFSERMTEARQRETSQAKRREATLQRRRKGFGVDQEEVNSYRLAAEESRDKEPPKSPTRQYFEYSRDDIVRATTQANSGTHHLKKSRTMPDFRESPSRQIRQGDASLFEGFSQLHLSSRILPHSFLQRTLSSAKFTVYRIPDLLKQVKSPAFELPDSVCDYVVCAVIASKSLPMDVKQTVDSKTMGTGDWERQWDNGSRNQRRFMALTLTDLQWTVDLYLFGTAVPRYHRLTPGTVIAVLNPGIMPPKSGKTDTGAFSLTLSDGDDTVLEIGTARDLGYCKTLKKDGKECGSWVNAAKTDICEWHLNAEIKKTQALRMGVNTGTNGFESRKRHLTMNDKERKKIGRNAKDGRHFDRETQSHFYVSNSGPTSGKSNVTRDGMGGDSFVPEGQLTRPSERNARLRKHLAAMEKEREIASRLGSRGHHGFGSAGAEYFRQQAKAREDKEREKENSSLTTKDGSGSTSNLSNMPSSIRATAILSTTNPSLTNGNGSRKRTAADVRLSPVKKTRFVTEKGIREAGRESLGPPVGGRDDSGSEGELEIV